MLTVVQRTVCRATAAPLLLGVRRCRLISTTRRGAQQQTRHTPLQRSIDGTDRHRDGRTDGQTDTVPFRRPCSAKYTACGQCQQFSVCRIVKKLKHGVERTQLAGQSARRRWCRCCENVRWSPWDDVGRATTTCDGAAREPLDRRRRRRRSLWPATPSRCGTPPPRPRGTAADLAPTRIIMFMVLSSWPKSLREFNRFTWWMQSARRVAANPHTKTIDLGWESA